MPYGKGRVVNVHSALYNEEVIIDEFVPYRDGTRSAWCTTKDGLEVSMRDDEVELTEVF